MGLLDDSYWKTEATTAPPAPPSPAPVTSSFVEPPTAQPQVAPAQAPATEKLGFFASLKQKILGGNQLTADQQAAKYGGAIGSPEYFQYKANENPYVKVGERLGPYTAAGAALGIVGGPVGVAGGALLGATIGALSFPSDETQWDSISTKGKIEYLAASGVDSALKIVTGIPQAIAQTPIRYGLSVAQPWVRMAQGKDFDKETLANLPVADIPFIGKTPTYFQSYQEARDSGLGPIGALLGTGGTALGDAVLLGSLGEAASKALQPRPGNVTPIGEAKVSNITPVKSLVQRDGQGRPTGVVNAVEGGASEYYTLPKTTAKQFGGNSGNTFFKLTQASPDSVELSVVQTRGGATQKVVDWLRGAKTSEGDFGPEVKIQSQVIQTGKSVFDQTKETLPIGENIFYHGTSPGGAANIEKSGFVVTNGGSNRGLGVSISSDPAASQSFALNKGSKPGKVFAVQLEDGTKFVSSSEWRDFRNGIAESLSKNKSGQEAINQAYTEATAQADAHFRTNGYSGVDYRGDNVTGMKNFENEVRVWDTSKLKMIGSAQGDRLAIPGQTEPVSIPNSVTKGFEMKPITSEQLTNLAKIGEANGVNPTIRDAVIRSVTGKSIMGEMTQSEYVKAAQTLGMFNGSDKYLPKDAFLNPVGQYLSPQRRWMRSYEEKSGVPVYSEVYVPVEDAIRARDMFRDTWRGQSRELFGKYAGPGYAAERQAINAYLKGETDAILGNSAFSEVARADMVKIADGLRQMYDQVGPQMGVPADIFLKDYQPRIQNIGGVFQLYKEGANIPKSIDFFAKFKRKGASTAPLIDDSLALFDMYVNAGSNSTFVSPVLERVGTFTEQLPGTLHNSVKAYVQEKMGYAGRLEQAMDEMVPEINRKLGINLPPDATRQIGDTILSTQYAGLLSQPATWFRQMFQYPLLGYARLGPKYSGEAYMKALTKEGIQEVADNGFLVDTSYPYGGSLAQESTAMGNVLSRYKSVTQTAISPNSFADNVQRSVVYHQFKMQFEDALQRFNDGKIPWSSFENEVGMSSFSPVDQNIARTRIVAGDVKGAFNHLVRDVIDETQFPYRKASTARVGYGFGGKLATSLLQWPLEASHTMGSWMAQAAKTGDFSKVIRYFAASVAIQRTMEKSLGADFTRSLYLGPVLTTSFVSPVVQLASNTISTVMNSPWVGALGGANNRQTFNDSKDKVLQTLQAAGIPGGLEIRNVQNFMRSVKRGPDADGQYAAVDSHGNVKYVTDFAGLFMGELMGFPIDEKVRESVLNAEMSNATVDQQEAKRKVMELFQQERYDEAASLMEQYSVKVTPQDFDNYYIPRSQRTFDSLPASLKAQFAPRVFPDAFGTGVQ